MLTLDLVAPGARRRRQFAAYLLADGEPALVDCGAGSHAASLREGLAAHGMAVADLRHLFVTHVHLDHSGGAGALVRENPGLTVWVHARGARHLIDPGRLVDSARRVFGDLYDRLWGETLPVPEANVRAIEAAGPLPVARRVEVLLTPGHAKHEVVYLTEDGTAVAGDVCGVAIDGSRFLEPPTPPPDVDVDAWLASIEAVRARAPRRLALGHFGLFGEPDEPLDGLAASLRRRAEWVADGEQAFVARAQAEVRAAVGEEGLRDYHRGSGLRTDYAGLRRWWEGRRAGRLAAGGPR
jgi:glyoxylase-like metal-dependent hydrolase (beta-lactamase superfamily II)